MVNSINLTDILNYLADFGVFAYLLPFLLIFAVVYGILAKGHVLGDNKGVHVTIAMAVGLLSLQFDYVSNFFAEIFPYAGIGIGVLLVALILMGLIASGETDGKWVKYVWFGIGAIAFISIIWASLDNFSFLWGRGIGDFSGIVPVLLVLLVLGGLIYWIVHEKKPKTPTALPATGSPS